MVVFLLWPFKNEERREFIGTMYFVPIFVLLCIVVLVAAALFR